MKKIAATLLILLILSAAALVVVPAVIDWEEQKPRIEAELRDLIGRDIFIQGDVALTLLPAPAFAVSDVRLANVPGGSAPLMARLGSLDVEVALMPLLGGNLRVESITLVDPELLLEVLPDGRRNWAPGQPDPETSAPMPPGWATFANSDYGAGASGGGFFGDLRLDLVTIRNGRVTYRDARAGHEETIEGVHASVSAGSLAGPFEGEGRLRFGGRDVSFRATLATWQQEALTPLSLTLGLLPEGTGTLRFNGTVGLIDGHPEFAGRVTGTANDLSRALVALGLDVDGLSLAAAPADVEAEVAFAKQRMTLTESRLRLPDAVLETEAALELADRPTLELHVQSPRLDLDQLFANGLGPWLTRSFSAPPGWQIRARIDVGALTYRDQVVRRTVLRLRIDDDVASVERLAAGLPGGTDLQFAGQLSGSDEGPRLAGRTEITADNLRSLLTWLGVDLSALPGARLRRAVLTSDVQLTPDLVSLNDLDMEVDLTRITGGMVIAVRDRPGLGLGLELDRLDLGAYLPDETEGAQALAGLVENYDANLEISVGELLYDGQVFEEVALDATLQHGSLDLRHLSIAGLPGGSGRISGMLTGFPDAPEIHDASFQIQVDEPLRFARHFDREAAALIEALGAFDASGTLSGQPGALQYNLEIAALDSSFLSAGQLHGWPETPELREAIVDVEGLRLDRLLRLFGAQPPDFAERLGRIDVTGRIEGWVDALTHDLNVDVAGGQLALAGTIDGLGVTGPDRADLNFRLLHRTPDQLLNRLMPEATAAASRPAPLDVTGRVVSGSMVTRFSSLEGRLGPHGVAGTVELSLIERIPQVVADLRMDDWPLALLLPQQPQRPHHERWSRTRFDTTALQSFDGTLRLRADRLHAADWVLEEVELQADVQRGRLDVTDFKARLDGGRLQATAMLDGSGRELALGLEAELDGADAGALIDRLTGLNSLTGRLTLSAGIDGRGASMAMLLSRLNGMGHLHGRLQPHHTPQQPGPAFLPQSVEPGQASSLPPDQAVRLLLEAFSGRDNDLQGDLHLRDGILRSDELRLADSGVELLISGILADLPAWAMDLEAALLRDQSEEPSLRARFAGALDAPQAELQILRPTSGASAPVDRQRSAPPLNGPLQGLQRIRQPLP